MTPAQLVEAAEDHATAAFPLRRFTRFAEIERYVQAMTSSRWWSLEFPDAPLEVTLLRRSHSATFSAAARTQAIDGAGVIWLVDGHGWGLETVLHELAHLVAGTAAGHGDRFARVLARLWRHEAGFEAWAALEAGFEAARSAPEGVSACDHRGGERPGVCPRPPQRL